MFVICCDNTDSPPSQNLGCVEDKGDNKMDYSDALVTDSYCIYLREGDQRRASSGSSYMIYRAEVKCGRVGGDTEVS